MVLKKVNLSNIRKDLFCYFMSEDYGGREGVGHISHLVHGKASDLYPESISRSQGLPLLLPSIHATLPCRQLQQFPNLLAFNPRDILISLPCENARAYHSSALSSAVRLWARGKSHRDLGGSSRALSHQGCLSTSTPPSSS